MDKFNVVDKKTMEASDAILKTCIEKLDLSQNWRFVIRSVCSGGFLW